MGKKGLIMRLCGVWHKMPGPTGAAGAPGMQGSPGAMGPIGPRGATGTAGTPGAPGMQGSPGAMGPIGPRGATGTAGAKGEPGEAAHIDHVEAITGEPGTPAYAYNSGTDEHADLVFVIPAGATGPEGPMGPAGPAGAGVDVCYGGLFNTDTGEFCTQPGEIAAMTFSDYLPAMGMHYDCNHSMVLERDGVYEIHYALRGTSKNLSQLHMAVTNDGVPIPCSRMCKDCTGNAGVDLSCVAMAEARAGAHLHLIAYGGDCGCECFTLGEGVNLMLYAKKLGDLPDPPSDYDHERDRGFNRDHNRDFDRERDFDRRFDRERERGYEQYPHR